MGHKTAEKAGSTELQHCLHGGDGKKVGDKQSHIMSEGCPYGTQEASDYIPGFNGEGKPASLGKRQECKAQDVLISLRSGKA